MKKNIIQEKSYAFALRIINLYKFLCEEKKEFVLSKQVLRSGTSIGANIEESVGAQSKKDFINKISISYKEARETKYWIRLLKDSEYITEEMYKSLEFDREAILKILGSIQKTAKNS